MKKKIFSILLIAVMVLSSFSAVFADGKTITINNAKAGHTYTIYQIFLGTTDGNESTNKLDNIQWGADAPAELKDEHPTAAAAAEAIANKANPEVSEENTVDIRTQAQGWTLTGGQTSARLASDGTVTFDNLADGYYIVVDNGWVAEGDEKAPDNDYDSAIMVQVIDNVNMNIKGDKPSSEKKVLDNNDSSTVFDVSGLQNVADSAWKDSADHDFGDEVPFKLTATTASNVSSYVKYHITFQDKQEAGLDAPKAWTVTVLDQTFELSETATEVTKETANTKIKVSKVTPDEGRTFAIRVDFESKTAGALLNEEVNSKLIKVTYTSKLNENAVIGSTGNPNTMCIKYSNNPEDKTGEEEGKTPDDKVIVFTYKTVVDKVDEKGEDLKGAQFQLYKEVPQATTGAKSGSEIKNEITDAKAKAAAGALKDDRYYVLAGKKTINNEVQFDFSGIDDGTYVLVETVVPAGYTAWDSVEIKITAEHSDGDAPALTELTCTAPFTTANKDAGTVDRTKEGSTHDRVSGEAYAEIINTSGSTLPETGGMGTTIIYILGAALVIGAGVVLVSRKKTNDR